MKTKLRRVEVQKAGVYRCYDYYDAADLYVGTIYQKEEGGLWHVHCAVHSPTGDEYGTSGSLEIGERSFERHLYES